MLFSNVNHVALADPRFLPLYEMANDLEAVLYIHPTHPLGVEAMTEYWLMRWSDFFRYDASPLRTRLRRHPEKFPKITWL